MRTPLGSLGCAAVFCWLAAACAAGPAGPPDPLAAVDHVGVGCADLARGVRELEARTGVRPGAGGEHPHLGTHNALLSLGDRQYLEILAPRPGAALDPRHAALRDLPEPTPVLWAVGTDDLRRTQEVLELQGYETSGRIPGSRVRPDGVELRWTTLHVTEPRIEGAPFFIQWGAGSEHPARTAPAGCTLRSFRVTAPNPAPLRRLLGVLGLRIRVDRAPEPGMEIVLSTPRGDVRID